MQQAGPIKGWTDSKLELLKIQLVDLVHQNMSGDGGTTSRESASALSDDSDLLQAAADALIEDGLVVGYHTLGGGFPSLSITSRGGTAVVALRERRTNRRLRSVACREALLDWAYDVDRNADLSDFSDDVRAHFDSQPFTYDEVQTAAKDLDAIGLVKALKTLQGVIGLSITMEGKTVVENYGGSISTYENRGQDPVGQRVTTVNLTGDGFSGVFSVGDQNQVTQTNGATSAELTELIQAVIEAARGTEIEGRINKLMLSCSSLSTTRIRTRRSSARCSTGPRRSRPTPAPTPWPRWSPGSPSTSTITASSRPSASANA